MKKFENPIINVSLFDVENIVTDSTTGSETPVQKNALEQAKEAANAQYSGKVITVTF